jgi:hypothetical protein
MGVLAKVAQLRWVKVTLDLDSFGGKARSASSYLSSDLQTDL